MSDAGEPSMTSGRCANEAATPEVLSADQVLRNRMEAEAGIPEISHSLPADYRVQVQILYWMADQRRLLEELLGCQSKLESQIEGLKREVVIGHEDLCLLQSSLSVSVERTEKKIEDLRDLPDRNCGHSLKMGELSGATNVGTSNHDTIDRALLRDKDNAKIDDEHLAFHAIVPSRTECDTVSGAEVEFSRTQTQEFSLRARRFFVTMQHISSIGKSVSIANHHDGSSRAFAHAVITSAWFDPICGCVIMTNAVWAGISTQMNIRHSLVNVGAGPAAKSTFDTNLNYFFFGFYLVELLFRILAMRTEFFTDPENKSWNIFDLILVMSGAYDIVVELSGIAPVNVSWLRLLKVVKMLKMLRVVRVMKIFRHMRTMLNSLVNSMLLLLWAVVVLTIILYIFGLCFLMSVSSYLNETPTHLISDQTMANIKSYFGSVPDAMISLFMTLTGGADWGEIAQPIKMVGGIYYFIFLMFIAFGVITVLNVLTGLIVDSAMKAALEDEDEVLTSIFEEDGDSISSLTQLYKDDPEYQKHGTISWPPFERDLSVRMGVAFKFLKAFEINATDAYRVFNMLSDDGKRGRVMVDSFITGCSKARGLTLGVEVFGMHHDIRKVMDQLKILMEYVEGGRFH